MPFRAGPRPQSLLFRLGGFSSVQLIHAWLTDVAGGVYGHDRCFLLSGAIVCGELIWRLAGQEGFFSCAFCPNVG